MSTDYYKVLRVPHDASQTEIQKAHRDLARTYHPDANPDNSDNACKFQEIQEAFDALNDPEKREMYDRYGIPFDPYHRWLGIPKSEQPASHYRLLGLAAFESDVGVISDAAEQRILHVRRRSRSLGENQQTASRIIHELMAAREHLLESQKKAAYDECLRQQMQKASASASQCEGDASTAASSEASECENAASNWQAEAPTARAPVSGQKGKSRERNPLVRMVGIVAMALLAVPVAFGISRLVKVPADKTTAIDSRLRVSSSGSDMPMSVARQSETNLANSSQQVVPASPLVSTVPDSRGKPNGPPAVSVPGVKVESRDASFAKVELQSGGQFVELEPNASVSTDDRYYHWSEIPLQFQGFYFLRNKEKQGTTKFKIAGDGTVMMAIIGPRYAGRGGEWQKEIVTQRDLEAAGWREVAKMNSYAKENHSQLAWVVLSRACKDGESFSYRTEKYLAPVLLQK